MQLAERRRLGALTNQPSLRPVPAPGGPDSMNNKLEVDDSWQKRTGPRVDGLVSGILSLQTDRWSCHSTGDPLTFSGAFI